MNLAIALAKSGEIESAKNYVRLILSKSIICEAFISISHELFKKGLNEHSVMVLNETLEWADKIENNDKVSILAHIATEFRRQGHFRQSDFLMRQSFENAAVITSDFKRSKMLKELSIEYSKQGKVKEALDCLSGFSDHTKIKVLRKIAAELFNQGNIDALKEITANVYYIVNQLNRIPRKRALRDISYEFSFILECEEHLEIAGSIDRRADRDIIISALVKREVRASRTKNAEYYYLLIGNDNTKNHLVSECINELFHPIEFHFVFSLLLDYLEQNQKKINVRLNDALLSLFVKQTFSMSKINQAFICVSEMSSAVLRSENLLFISDVLFDEGKPDDAYNLVSQVVNLTDIIDDNYLLKKISHQIIVRLIKLSKTHEAIEFVNSIKIEFVRGQILFSISMELAASGDSGRAVEIMKAAIECSKHIVDTRMRRRSLCEICEGLVFLGQYDLALTCCKDLLNDARRDHFVKVICVDLLKKGRLEQSIGYKNKIDDEVGRCAILIAIVSELQIQGKTELAFGFVREAHNTVLHITNEDDKNDLLISLSAEYTKLGKIDEAKSCLQDISNDYLRSSALNQMSNELSKLGLSKQALLIALEISDTSLKFDSLNVLYVESVKQVNQEAIDVILKKLIICAHELDNDYSESAALKDIACQLANQGKWSVAESIGMDIPQLAERHSCWKTTAENTYKEHGWHKSLQVARQFQSDEARLFYLKGWAEAVNEYDADAMCVQEALNQMAHDSDSIETLLQKYALHEVFFGNAGPDKINQLNRTFNIQWALDIVAQFPKEESAPRLSTNLVTWLHEVADEDDRDQITLWAKQVAKGKITEEEFGERVRGIE